MQVNHRILSNCFSSLHISSLHASPKKEHDVDDRNLDRHRRDALAMERLTSSPNIIDIYGYCANTVWTEFLPNTLDHVMKEMSQPESKLLDTTTQMAQSLKDLHSYDIIHADITPKQFLVSSDLKTVKLNDFNRCRFLPRKKVNSTIKCPVRIPSAPGNSRAPEEYEIDFLTEQLDVFSLAHIWYSVLTHGQISPFKSLSKPVKEAIKLGHKPILLKKYQSTKLTSSLAVLMYLAYERDPKTRIKSSELVDELKKLTAT